MYFFFINMGVWASLCVPQLILQALKLTIIQAFSGYHTTELDKKANLLILNFLLLDYLLDG
jgi:hypothetical protein